TVRDVRRREGRQLAGPTRGDLRIARRERRGQDDYHQDALRAARADDWRGTPRGRTQPALRRRAPTDRLYVAKVFAIQRPLNRREPGFLRGRLRRARRRERREE